MQNQNAPGKLIIGGKDNYGNPRQDFADYLASVNESEYLEIADQYIWLSAYAANNPHSDYHWKADACYDEANRRGNTKLYSRAWHNACGNVKPKTH